MFILSILASEFRVSERHQADGTISRYLLHVHRRKMAWSVVFVLLLHCCSLWDCQAPLCCWFFWQEWKLSTQNWRVNQTLLLPLDGKCTQCPKDLRWVVACSHVSLFTCIKFSRVGIFSCFQENLLSYWIFTWLSYNSLTLYVSSLHNPSLLVM